MGPARLQLATCLKTFVKEYQQPAGAASQGAAAGKAGKASTGKGKAVQGKPAKQAPVDKGAKAGKAPKDPKVECSPYGLWCLLWHLNLTRDGSSMGDDAAAAR